MPEDHDSSSGTENPNKGKNDAKGVTEQAKEKQGSSSEQKPDKEGEHLDYHPSQARVTATAFASLNLDSFSGSPACANYMTDQGPVSNRRR